MTAPTTPRVQRVLPPPSGGAGATSSDDLLSDPERLRAQRFRREDDRLDFIAAHLLAREVVAELLGVAADEVRLAQSCPECGADDHGPPHVSVPGTHVSSPAGPTVRAGSARSPRWPRWASTSSASPAARSITDAGVHVLSPGESAQVRQAADPRIAFLHWWTRKEALVKVGAIELDDFGATDLSEHPQRWGSWALTSWHDRGHDVVAAVATTPGS